MSFAYYILYFAGKLLKLGKRKGGLFFLHICLFLNSIVD